MDVSCPQWSPGIFLVPESAQELLTVSVGGDGDYGESQVEKVPSSQVLAAFLLGASDGEEPEV